MAKTGKAGDAPLVAPAGGANPPLEALTEGLDSPRAVEPGSDAAREQAVREAAYAAYERRGKTEGDPVRDWLDAEEEVRNRST